MEMRWERDREDDAKMWTKWWTGKQSHWVRDEATKEEREREQERWVWTVIQKTKYQTKIFRYSDCYTRMHRCMHCIRFKYIVCRAHKNTHTSRYIRNKIIRALTLCVNVSLSLFVCESVSFSFWIAIIGHYWCENCQYLHFQCDLFHISSMKIYV